MPVERRPPLALQGLWAGRKAAVQVTAAVLVNAKLFAGSPFLRLGSAEPPGQQFFMGEFHGPYLEVLAQL